MNIKSPPHIQRAHSDAGNSREALTSDPGQMTVQDSASGESHLFLTHVYVLLKVKVIHHKLHNVDQQISGLSHDDDFEALKKLIVICAHM